MGTEMNQIGLLIASSQMQDPNFSGSVVLMCQHNEKGAFGIVINRQTNLTVGEVLDDEVFTRPSAALRPVLWGGPVNQQIGFVLYKGFISEEIGWNLANGEISVTQSRDILERMIREEREYRLVLGSAGWGPGQLEDEIAEGSWFYTEADAATVIDTPLSNIYDAALASLGLSQATAWMAPVNE